MFFRALLWRYMQDLETLLCMDSIWEAPHFYADSSIAWPEVSNKDSINQLIEYSAGHHQQSLRYKDILYGLKVITSQLGINLVSGTAVSKSAEIIGSVDKC